MNRIKHIHRNPAVQRGVVLTVTMLFLLVVTIFSVVAATNSSVGLRMASNMQDSYQSFQAAEAGLAATLSLSGTNRDPFDGDNEVFPLASTVPHPLSNLPDGSRSVDVDVLLVTAATSCPARAAGSSVDLFNCEYYGVNSVHTVPEKARTRVDMGVVRTLIGSAAR